MVFDIEPGKQLKKSHFICSPCLGKLLVRKSLKPRARQSKKPLPLNCVSQLIILLSCDQKPTTGIFLRIVPEAMLFRKRLGSQNLVFLNSTYSLNTHFLFTILLQQEEYLTPNQPFNHERKVKIKPLSLAICSLFLTVSIS